MNIDYFHHFVRQMSHIVDNDNSGNISNQIQTHEQAGILWQ